jgi:hypothetical protein
MKFQAELNTALADVSMFHVVVNDVAARESMDCVTVSHRRAARRVQLQLFIDRRCCRRFSLHFWDQKPPGHLPPSDNNCKVHAALGATLNSEMRSACNAVESPRKLQLQLPIIIIYKPSRLRMQFLFLSAFLLCVLLITSKRARITCETVICSNAPAAPK